MKIHVVSSVNEVKADELVHKTAIVIDVLRATSTMVTALSFGSASILPVETVSQARDTCQPGDLLAGERFCKKINGFDFGNSPLEFMTGKLKEKRIVMTTTNGTRAIQKSLRASTIITGAMVNASACAQAALEIGRDVVIVCAGTQDVFSLEDGLCAGFIIEEMKAASADHLDVDDFGLAMNSAFVHEQERLQDTLLNCQNGRRLRKLGFMDDVIYCTEQNRYSIVPMVRGHEITIYPKP